MSDTGARLRALFEEIAPPVDIRGAMASRERVAGPRRDWLIALAVASAVVLVGLGGWLLASRRGSEPPVITGPLVTTSTTGASTTTTTLAGWGLDALAAFQAGPVPPAAACPAGSTPDVPGDPAAPRPVSYEVFSASLAAFDRESGLLVRVIEPRGESEPGRYETWTFDPCRNQWQEMSSAGLDSGGRLSGLTYDHDSDLIVGVDEAGAVWAYDANAGTWATRPWAVGKAMLPNDWPAIYHDASGLVVFYEPWPGPGTSAWAYDVDSDARYELGLRGKVLGGRLMHDPVTERFFDFTWDLEVERWEPGSGWRGAGVPVPSVLRTSPACNTDPFLGLLSLNELAFDEATGRFVFFCAGKAAAAFDPAALTWEVLDEPGSGAPRYFSEAVYDSSNDRLILLGGGGMWSYDGGTGEWIELLGGAVAAEGGGADSQPEALDEMLAPSGVELWGVAWDTVWHFADGGWQRYTAADGLPADAGIRDLAFGPAGTIWVATDRGVVCFAAGTWVVVDDEPAFAVGAGPDGTVWAARATVAAEGEPGTIVAFKALGDTWTLDRVVGHPLDFVDSLAVGSDGSVWIGSHSGGYTLPGRGLARFDGTDWEVIDHLGLYPISMVGDIAIAPNGDVWTIVVDEHDLKPLVVQWDGQRWVQHAGVLEGAGFDRYHRLWVNPDGTVGVPAPEGLATFTDGWWTVTPGDWTLAQVAPDGTIWVGTGSGVVRLPAGEVPGGWE